MGIVASLFVLIGILPVALIIWLLVYLMRKNEWGKEKVGQNDFEKSLRLIYMYAVTLVMLFACIVFAISAITSLGYVFFPTADADASYALKQLIPALVGVVITIPTLIYHFKRTKVKNDL